MLEVILYEVIKKKIVFFLNAKFLSIEKRDCDRDIVHNLFLRALIRSRGALIQTLLPVFGFRLTKK